MTCGQSSVEVVIDRGIEIAAREGKARCQLEELVGQILRDGVLAEGWIVS